MPHYSPSELHQHLMDQKQPLLSFKAGEDYVEWRERLRGKLSELVGMPQVERPALNGQSIWRREFKEGTVEKIQFTTEPYSDALAFVCIPKDIKPPYTWVICLQGHSTGAHNSVAVDREDNEKTIEVEGDRDFGLGCMQRGMAAICLEQRSFGERRELKQEMRNARGCMDASMHALQLGRTMIGERVFDVDRTIDYLESRDDVDPKRIGVMGNSGGGTISLFSAALLDRLQFAMPSCYFCTFKASLMSIKHCECNYVPGLLAYSEMADVMGLFAPKPVVLVAGQTDDIFPIEAVKASFEKLKEIYAAAGAPDQCRLVIGQGGHRFYADPGWAAAKELIPQL